VRPAMNTKERVKRNALFCGSFRSVVPPTPRSLIGHLLRLLPTRRGFGYVGKHLVLPLDVSHPIQQPLEFFGRETRAEARDSARDFATGSRDRF
jgi:hypothetical protein